MAAKHIFPLYSRNSGLEITPETKESGTKKTKAGMVQLRFFLLKAPGEAGKTTQIKFQLQPWEAFDLCARMNKIVRDGGKDKITHKFIPSGDAAEVVTTVTIEKWERNGKSGLGIAVGRGDTFISVPVDQASTTRFLYAAEFLKFLSTRQGWVDAGA
jgi:hypothetical protein